MQTIERSKIAKDLEAFCDKYDTYGAAAKALGITLAQLSTARNDESTVIPAKALAKLGYGYTFVYVRKADMPAKTSKPKKAAKKAAKPAPKKTAKPKAKKPAPKPAAPVKAKKPKAKKPAKPKPAAPVKTNSKNRAASPGTPAPKPESKPESKPAAPARPKPQLSLIHI